MDFFRNIGPVEIGVILVIILIIFGVGKLPQVGGAIGKSINEFRKASRGDTPENRPSDLKTEAKSETVTDKKPQQ